MATVFIPSLLRELTGGAEKIVVPGNSVQAVIDELERRHPGIKERLCSGADLAPGIIAAVDTQVAQLGLYQPVGENSEVHFLPAIGGG